MNLVLANIDLKRHMTDEGEQLQAGLELAGWTLAGHGYGDGCKDVRELLRRHNPRIVLVTPREDWDRTQHGCFDPAVSFENISALAGHGGFVAAVVKDSPKDIQRIGCEEIAADAIVHYYHEQAVTALSPWMNDYRMVRTYHSVDADYCRTLDLTRARVRGVVSGAHNDVYPTRRMAIVNAGELRIRYHKHPGYGNRGSVTRDYLNTLADYKVHVATASKFGFALRKIIESVAVGCTPVTDLPAWDVLPEIDGALVRIPQGATLAELKAAIDHAEQSWDLQRTLDYARKCLAHYDFRATTLRLSESLVKKSWSQAPAGASDRSCAVASAD